MVLKDELCARMGLYNDEGMTKKYGNVIFSRTIMSA